MQIFQLELSQAGTPGVSANLKQSSAVLFEPDIQIQVLPARGDDVLYSSNFSSVYPVAWLPRGEYRLQCHLHDLNLPAGEYRLRLIVFAVVGGERKALTESRVTISNPSAHQATGLNRPAWSLHSAPGTFAIEELGWNRGHEDWFYRHFDHAALVVSDYLLKRHPLLKGRILDVGCGDGIIDLGMFLRLQPEELVGIDPFKGYERLPDVISANHLPPDVLNDSRLKFRDEDANNIPYADDYFDVVVSWGSLEHIAGAMDRPYRKSVEC